jgi:hypothetical protein
MSCISFALSEALIMVSGVERNGSAINDQLNKHLLSFKPLNSATVTLIVQTPPLSVSSKS